MRIVGLVGALALLVSCTQTVPQNVPTSEPARVADLEQVLTAVVQKPAVGRSLGLRDQFDGKVADYSAAGIEGRIALLNKAKAELASIEAKQLDSNGQLDLELLRLAVAEELFQLQDLKNWQRRPQFYDELFSVESYLTRDYAALDVRAARLLKHVQAALPQTIHIKKTLKGPLPESFVRTDIGIYRGYAEYLSGDVVKLLQPVSDSKLTADAIAAVLALAREATAVADHLEQVELPRADQSYAMGVEKYQRLLAVQEALELPLAEFERMAEEDLQRNKTAYQELRGKAKETKPKVSELLQTATRLTFDAKAFLEQKGLVTLPPDGKIEVKETPPFMQWNSAFLDGPGPFDRPDLAAYYYITLPNPSWPQQEQDDYVMSHGTLLATSVHEVFPGHFLHGQWIRRAPTRAQQMLGSYSFVEGWAHYTEQLMVEEGFGGGTPEVRLGQLGDALLRNCRFVASIGLHTKGMTLAQAEDRFVNDCFQDRATAKQQALRGTFDPGYFAYTLGKLQILKLREEVKAALGANYSARKFHDALLSHGAPPVPLLRSRIKRSLGIE